MRLRHQQLVPTAVLGNGSIKKCWLSCTVSDASGEVARTCAHTGLGLLELVGQLVGNAHGTDCYTQ